MLVQQIEMPATNSNYRLFAEMNRQELREAAPSSLVVLPIGATEQHGPHLATGMDFITVEKISREAAQIAAASIPVIVAPVLPFGSSHHHLVFGATLSITTETYFKVLMELLDCLVTDGFRHMFIVNGHGGNQELMQLAARDTALRHRVAVAAGSYWTIAWEPLLKVAAYGAKHLPGHAGDFETSLMLANRPELVKVAGADLDPAKRAAGAAALENRAPYRSEVYGLWEAFDGYTDDPTSATAEKGRAYYEAIARSLAAHFVSFATKTEPFA